MKKVREVLEKDLFNNICPFWEQMLDKEYGGFYGATDMEGNIIENAPKGLVYTSRILYSYSILFMKYKDEKYLSLAKHAYRFLVDCLNDKECGGFYWSCRYDGTPLNEDKHLYGHSFALYGLSAYYKASNDIKILGYASEIVKIIKDTINDFPNNYYEQFSRNFIPKDNVIMDGYNMTPEITTNTLLHLAESLSLYYSCLKNENAKNLVIDILEIIFKYGYDEKNRSLYQFLNRDLKSVINAVSYGHNLEVSWLFMDVMKLCEFNNEKYYEYCMEMFQGNFELSYNNNYIINEIVDGITDKSAIWWVQAEALAAIDNINRICPNKKYEEAIRSITNFIEKYFINDKKEWYWGINEDLTVQNGNSICGMWKANYHNVRAVLKIMEATNGE